MSVRSVAAAAIVLAAAAPLRAQQGTFRSDSARNGVYASGTKDALAGWEWRVQTGGDVNSSPTIVRGVVYVGSGDGLLYALDVRSGATRWTFDAGSPVASSPAVADGRVFVGARNGAYFAVDAATGKRVWTFRTGADLPLAWGHESGDHFTSSPVVAGGRVIFGGGDGVLYTLDAATGKELRRARTGGRIRSSPAVSGDRVVVGSFDGYVWCYSLKTGAELWRFATAGVQLESGKFGYDRRSVQSSPAIAGGTVFIGARDGFLYAIDLATGKEKWHFDHRISWVNASAAVDDGIVYTASSDAAFVQALDAATGVEKWHVTSDVPVWSSPALSGGHLYVGDWIGRLHAIDRRDGARQWLFRTGSMILSSPAVSGALVIVGSTDGSVYAVRTGDETVQRAVFFDSAYLKATRLEAPDKLAAYFSHRGYQQLGAAALAGWMEGRVRDRAPSTVVFAMDFVPAPIAQPPYETSLLRRYLESGGKIVWAGLPPAIWPRDSTSGDLVGSLLALDWAASSALLGVTMDAAIFDNRGVHATAAGARWGLPTRWRDAWSVDARGVSEVLGRDEWGLAAAWVKSYGGAPGTGFVRVPAADPFVVYLAAEYRPGALK
jgi:eukaryotic-like serine/threonine-protein kinase